MNNFKVYPLPPLSITTAGEAAVESFRQKQETTTESIRRSLKRNQAEIGAALGVAKYYYDIDDQARAAHYEVEALISQAALAAWEIALENTDI